MSNTMNQFAGQQNLQNVRGPVTLESVVQYTQLEHPRLEAASEQEDGSLKAVFSAAAADCFKGAFALARRRKQRVTFELSGFAVTIEPPK